MSVEADEQWQVTASTLNVRGGPGVEFEKLAWGPLRNGEALDVISWHGDWAMIEADGGRQGFVHTAFIG